MQTEIEKLPELIEAILFVAGQGVEIKDIAEKLEVDEKTIKKIIEDLKTKHQNDGINIITYKNSAQMCSNPSFADDISLVLNPIREKQLTKAALETLAIIAYKQPITRLEIEQVRNVNCDYAMQVLTNFKLVEVVGRKDAVGKPLLYGTTDEFLKHFNLQDINDLPDYDEILERIEIIHAEDSKGDSLYGSTEIIPEEQLKDSASNSSSSEQKELTKNESTTQLETSLNEQTADSIEKTFDENQNENQNEDKNKQDIIGSAKEENKDYEKLNNLDNFNKEIIENNQILQNNLESSTDDYENLDNIKKTLLEANSQDENAILDSFKDGDLL